MIFLLSDYKEWYESQQIIHGDIWADTNKMFLQDNGKPLHPTTINSWLRKFNLKHGFNNISPHELRHTTIILQILVGVILKLYRQELTHAIERITLDIYTHSLKSQDKEAADIYNNYLKL